MQVIDPNFLESKLFQSKLFFRGLVRDNEVFILNLAEHAHLVLSHGLDHL